jgi:prepilin peptidase CpaA
MAPFIAAADMVPFLFLFCATMIAAYTAHKIGKHVPAIRAATPDWASWQQKKDFPMGLALAGSLGIYFALALGGQ